MFCFVENMNWKVRVWCGNIGKKLNEYSFVLEDIKIVLCDN